MKTAEDIALYEELRRTRLNLAETLIREIFVGDKVKMGFHSVCGFNKDNLKVVFFSDLSRVDVYDREYMEKVEGKFIEKYEEIMYENKGWARLRTRIRYS